MNWRQSSWSASVLKNLNTDRPYARERQWRMPDIIDFQDAIEQTKGKDRALLLGNGFSIQHFSYKTVLEKAGLKDGDPLKALFKALDTCDFEALMRALHDAAVVAAAYGNKDQSKTFTGDADRLRKALVHAVRETHPAHREDIPKATPICVVFLNSFFTIFTLNDDV